MSDKIKCRVNWRIGIDGVEYQAGDVAMFHVKQVEALGEAVTPGKKLAPAAAPPVPAEVEAPATPSNQEEQPDTATEATDGYSVITGVFPLPDCDQCGKPIDPADSAVKRLVEDVDLLLHPGCDSPADGGGVEL